MESSKIGHGDHSVTLGPQEGLHIFTGGARIGLVVKVREGKFFIQASPCDIYSITGEGLVDKLVDPVHDRRKIMNRIKILLIMLSIPLYFIFEKVFR